MIGLSPLPTGHPLRFQPKWVRPSTGSYSRFSLPMGRSPGFASAPRYCAPCSDSLSLRLASKLNLAARCNSLAHSTKGTPSHPKKGAPTACRRTVSGAVSLPSRGAFHLSSRYSSTIGHRRVLSLGGWSPLIPTGFHVSGGTWDAVLTGRDGFRVRGCHPVPPGLPAGSATRAVCNPPGGR